MSECDNDCWSMSRSLNVTAIYDRFNIVSVLKLISLKTLERERLLSSDGVWWSLIVNITATQHITVERVANTVQNLSQ